MSRENLLDKIRKLRALSQDKSGATVEEAATAARIVEKLIQENEIAEAELEISVGAQEEVYEDGTSLTSWEKRQTVWQNILLTHLCGAYNCQGVIKFGKDFKLGFYVIGRPSDVSVMRYQYAYFVLELTRLAQLLAPNTLSRGSGKHWYKSFYLGATRAIGDSLASAKKEVRAQAGSSALAVIDRHAQEALDLKRKLYPNNKTASFNSSINQNAYELGKRAGSNLNSKQNSLGSSVRGLLGK